MATNRISETPYLYYNGAAKASGKIVKIGAIHGVLNKDAPLNTDTVVLLRGRFSYTKATATSFAKGDVLRYDATADKLTKVATGNSFIGIAAAAATAAGTSVEFLLNEGIQP